MDTPIFHRTVDDNEEKEQQRDSATPSENSEEIELENAWGDDYQYHRDEINHLEQQLQPRQKFVKEESLCCCRNRQPEAMSAKFRMNVRRTVNLLNLSPRQKALILDRYVSLMEQYSKTKMRYGRLYSSVRVVTTACSIITPALVSIQPLFGSDSFANPIYWCCFGSSFCLALCNGYVSLFKLDKKTVSSTKAFFDLESIGFEYFSLVSRFAAVDGEPPATHANKFHLFMTKVEEIRKGEAQVDYRSSDDSNFRTTSMVFRGGAATSATPQDRKPPQK